MATRSTVPTARYEITPLGPDVPFGAIVSIDTVPTGIPLHAGLCVVVTTDTGYRGHLLGARTLSAQ